MIIFPKKGRGEVTKLAAELNISATLVSQVLSGEKCFTLEQAQVLKEYLHLSEVETDYMMLLVLQERSGTTELKKHWEAQINKKKKEALSLSTQIAKDGSFTPEEECVFYSSTIYSLVRLYTSVGGKGKSLTDICERFGLSRREASDILKFLTDAGLCEKRQERFFLGRKRTHLDVKSIHRSRQHINWRLKAIQHSQKLTDEELMYTASVSLSKGDFVTLRYEMVEFIKRFLDKVHSSPEEELACFNIDFFWS